MNKKRLAIQVLGVSPSMLTMVLQGKRTFSYNLSKKVSRVLKTGVDLWANPQADIAKRVEAVERYLQRC